MRKRSLFVTGCFVLALAAAADPSSAWAAWGCAARNPSGAWGNSHGYSTRAEARATAMGLCGSAGCQIIGCSPNVDSLEEANAIWAPSSPMTRCVGSDC